MTNTQQISTFLFLPVKQQESQSHKNAHIKHKIFSQYENWFLDIIVMFVVTTVVLSNMTLQVSWQRWISRQTDTETVEQWAWYPGPGPAPADSSHTNVIHPRHCRSLVLCLTSSHCLPCPHPHWPPLTNDQFLLQCPVETLLHLNNSTVSPRHIIMSTIKLELNTMCSGPDHYKINCSRSTINHF